MRESFLPFCRPLLGDDEIAEVVATLRSDCITTGPKVNEFEQAFADYIGAPAALAVNSCTAALHVALAAYGIGPGDAVFTTPMTFCSTVHTILHVGATPVLVDIDPLTANIDPQILQQAVEGVRSGLRAGSGWRAPMTDAPLRARAILPVHYAGHPCDLEAIDALARKHDLRVVEDAAHALPASHDGRLIGQKRDVDAATAFSFYATKNLVTAEGGMLTGSPDFIDEARIWSLHGMSRDAYARYSSEGSWFYDVLQAGFKYNMTDIQASLGLHQLRKLPDFQERRLAIANRYHEGFAGIAEIETPATSRDVTHAWHLYVIRLHLDRLAISRAAFIEELKARNIGTSVHFIPINRHRLYRERFGFEDADVPVASGLYERIVSLPLFPRMSDSDVDDVVRAVTEVVGSHRR